MDCSLSIILNLQEIMKLKIKVSSLIQYSLLYLMLICNQSNLYQVVLAQNEKIIAILALGLLGVLLWKAPKKSLRALFLLGVLLLATMVVRFIRGGIGINFWFEMAIKIEIAYLAVVIETEHFPTRFVRIVYFFAIISLIGWLLQLLGVNPITRISSLYRTGTYKATYDHSGYTTVYYTTGCGYLLFSIISGYSGKNIGIFTEPGIYQMVINSALLILMYMPETLFLGLKQKKRIFVVLIVTMLSIQSTSGYFGITVLLLGVLLVKNKRSKIWKKAAISAAITGALAIGVDYAIRGDNSILSIVVLNKLIGVDNRFSLVAEGGTGKYRMATIGMSLLAMMQHPLGLGVNGWYSFSAVNTLVGPGGWPFKMGAMIGVLPLAYALVWIFRPLRYLNRGWITKLVIVFLYFNTALAQSSAFYPALLIIPIWLDLSYQRKKQEGKVRGK